MLVMNDSGLRHLLSSKFEITGEGSAAAGPVGRHASAGTDWKLNTELLTYSRSRGIFAGLTLEGACRGAGCRCNRGDLWQRPSLQEDLDGRGCCTRSGNVLLARGGRHQSSSQSAGSHGTGATGAGESEQFVTSGETRGAESKVSRFHSSLWCKDDLYEDMPSGISQVPCCEIAFRRWFWVLAFHHRLLV